MAGIRIAEDIFFVDRGRGASLQAQIRETVVSGILSRQLPVGARLPSSRRLAEHLGIARVTVTTAYQELVAQGYLATEERSGYVVAQTAPVARLRPADTPEAAAGIDWSARIPQGLGERRRVEKPPDWRRYPYPFIYGQMDMSLFDHGAWRECARQALGLRDFEDMAGDVAVADDPMLVNYICARTLPRRGIRAGPEEVLVTLGAQNGLWLACQLLLRAGSHAACENPGHPDIAGALRWSGARVTAIDVDGLGLPPEALPRDVDAVVVTPSHHSPTGATMPIERRRALLDAAERDDFVVIEDDYDFEMSFLAPPTPALKSIDHAGRVIYLGSFSKALFPGLRLGYLVGPAAFVREARGLRALMLRHPPGHLQRTTAYFLALGYYDQLVRRMREAFAERHAVAVRAVEREGIEIRGAAAFGGTSLWLGGPEGSDSLAIAERARADGVLIEPGAPFFDPRDWPVRFFRLGYSSIRADRIDRGIALLAERMA